MIARKRIATECPIEHGFESKKPTALEALRKRGMQWFTFVRLTARIIDQYAWLHCRQQVDKNAGELRHVTGGCAIAQRVLRQAKESVADLFSNPS